MVIDNPFQDYPGPPEEPLEREQWWFSDGAWLDQGDSSAAAAIAWTHWLADLGTRRAGMSFNRDFALALYDDARQAADQPQDASGTFPWAPAAVLRQQGLLTTAYVCRDEASLVAALLGAGPVVMSLVWHEGMESPELVEGHPVCRVTGAIRGGQVVLLNGVSLDLELGGVKGFARLKNSWGRAWGRGGHALISLSDLWDQLRLGAEAVVGVAADAVRPGGVPREDRVLFPETSTPEPVVERYRREAISSDQWTTVDRLGASAYAEAIARGIRHRDTAPPLTIGIKAPWGAGKTSLMRMIRDRLEWPDAEPAGELRTIRLEAFASEKKLRAVTNRAVLRRLRKQPKDEARLTAGPAPAPDTRSWLPTVWFNPWNHRSAQELWAGLAQEIIGQTTRRMKRAEREHFWLRLNARRVDEHAVRRRIHLLVLSRVLPFALVAALLVVVGVVLPATGLPRWVGYSLAAGSPAGLAVLLAGQSVAVLGSKVRGSLASLVSPVAGAGTGLAEFSSAVVRSPDYGKDAGYLAAWRQDLAEVLALVATPDRPLVVFVDDLDRCPPGTVVEVFEAINAFLAGEFANAIFVIALEPRMVAAHLESAYQDLTATLKDGGAGLGWKFLEKFIQLPLTLPTMVAAQSAVLLRTLFPSAAPVEPTPPGLAEAPRPPDSLAQAVKLAGRAAATDDVALKDAVRAYVDRQLSVDTPGFEDVIDYSSRCLSPNPREIKRFANLFRFLVMITTERRLLGLPAPEELHTLAKLAVLALRWPPLLPTLKHTALDGRTVLELVEVTTDEDELRTSLGEAGLSEEAVDQLLTSGVPEFLQEGPRIGSHSHAYL